MAIIQSIPISGSGGTYINMTTDEAIAGTNTEERVISAKVLNDAIDNKIPTIPTVNNGTLTIQKNGTTVKTFTANSSSNVTCNITVPTKVSDLTNDSGFARSADLSKVATSGSYNDLSNKPTIPTVNNGTLTIQKNGTTVKTFTANSSSNVTCNITVPTKVSDLTNDSGFIADVSGKADKATTLSGYGITDAYTKTQVDKKVSDLVNSAPETLDTLNELASALGNDPNFATTVSNQIGTKANDSDVVHKSGNETINGSKTFSSDINIVKNSPFFYSQASDYVKGETPNSNIYQGIRFFDNPNSSSANHITGGFELMYDTTGYTVASINARTYANGSQLWRSINLRVPNDSTRSIDFYPVSNSEINLGTSSNKWKDVYATTLHGNLVGNADTATKATNNASGNELSNDIIKGLSVNGKVITYTKLDGSTGTITTQDTNTDTKVTNTLGNTTKAYITGTTSAKTNTGTQIFDSGVYLTTTAGQLHADIDFPITEAQVNEILGIA